jgi:hypothetical protein
MPRAVLKNGVIVPLEPLPPEWTDGKELWVEEPSADTPEEIDRWYEELEAMCAVGDPEDDARLQAALDEVRREAKEQMRREMGLP